MAGREIPAKATNAANWHHRAIPLIAIGPGHLPARGYALELRRPRVAATMSAQRGAQHGASFFCSNCTNRDTKKVVCGECLEFAFLALHAAYETQTQRPATYFDRVRRGEAWWKCAKPYLYLSTGG